MRCIGAEKIRRVITKKNFTHFVVAEKYIYPLPAHPSPPSNGLYTRHFAILLAEDMQLVPKSENLRAWKTVITREHLHELYTIMTAARGSSYRPDNICYTRNGKFAFIDTEYPSSGPDYTSIRPHLSPKMQRYWDRLIKHGGH